MTLDISHITSFLETTILGMLRDIGIEGHLIRGSTVIDVDLDMRMRAYILIVRIPHLHYYRDFVVNQESPDSALRSIITAVHSDFVQYSRDPHRWFTRLFQNTSTPSNESEIEPSKESITSTSPAVRMLRNE